jgi:D-sedoheptulose 7-phosphate isomerase
MALKARTRELADLDLQADKWFRQYHYLFEDLRRDTWKKGQVSEVALVIAGALKSGNKLMSCGNGGSCSDSNHLVAEFNNQLSMGRTRALPAIDLCAMTSTVTAIGNDWGYEYIFSKQIEGLGKQGDVLVGISTSGRSANVLQAILSAKRLGITTVLLTGKFRNKYTLGIAGAGVIEIKPDYLLTVDSEHTALIQGAHGMMLHTIVGLVDYALCAVDYFDKETW